MVGRKLEHYSIIMNKFHSKRDDEKLLPLPTPIFLQTIPTEKKKGYIDVSHKEIDEQSLSGRKKNPLPLAALSACLVDVTGASLSDGMHQQQNGNAHSSTSSSLRHHSILAAISRHLHHRLFHCFRLLSKWRES